MSITPDQAPESLIAADPNALFLRRTDEVNALLDSGASLSGHERNCCFLNTGEGRFATASATSGFDFYDDARAVAKCDWDQDGDLDLIFSNRTAPRLRFLKNTRQNTGNHLSVRLIGTSSNRDAIGARVVLQSGDRKLLRGLRAGEGFLGQSSKWLHFGLGGSEQIDSLTVFWPGGEAETFRQLKAGTRVTLKQGSALPVASSSPDRTIELPAREFELPIPTSRAAVRLSARLPIPALETLTPTGQRETIQPDRERPLLVMLWASWCPASMGCLDELHDHDELIRQAGIDLLAISVDGLDEGKSTTFDEARESFAALGLTATLRRAHPDLLHQLQLIADQIVAQANALPLPSAFLLDPGGKVAAFYRGPIPVNHLLTTAKGLSDTDPEAIFRKAVPFPGTWVGQPRTYAVHRVVQDFIKAGYLKAALDFAMAHREDFPSSLTFAEVFSAAGNYHSDRGDFADAITSYEKALSVHEESPPIHFNLALAHERLSRTREALAGYRRAIELDPKITVAHLNRGAILARNPQTLDEAIASLRQAIRLNPNIAASYYHLGMALERSRRFPEAFQNYQKARQLAPDHYGNAMQLAHLLERSGKLAEALAHYQEIALIHPQNPRVPFQMGMVREKQKDFRAAISHYRKALALDPDDLPALNNLAFLLATRPEHLAPAEAVSLARKATRLTARQQPAILDTLVSAYLAAGKIAEANAVLDEALLLAKNKGQTALKKELEKKKAKLSIPSGQE